MNRSRILAAAVALLAIALAGPAAADSTGAADKMATTGVKAGSDGLYFESFASNSATYVVDTKAQLCYFKSTWWDVQGNGRRLPLFHTMTAVPCSKVKLRPGWAAVITWKD